MELYVNRERNGRRHGRPEVKTPTVSRYALRDASLPREKVGYERMKRAMDLLICLLILPFVLLAMAICAIAIRMESPGPIFFFQRRTGRGGHPFRMFKLRTMLKDAEKLKKRYAHLNVLSYPDSRFRTIRE